MTGLDSIVTRLWVPRLFDFFEPIFDPNGIFVALVDGARFDGVFNPIEKKPEVSGCLITGMDGSGSLSESFCSFFATTCPPSSFLRFLRSLIASPVSINPICSRPPMFAASSGLRSALLHRFQANSAPTAKAFAGD
jgi:hypothetical protein